MAECVPTSGWQDDKTLLESCRHLLSSRFASDVEFSVGNQQKIVKAHKFILICRSSVFQAMFTNDFADSRETIQIPDIEVDIFEKLLTFMYTDDTDITGENVLPLLYTAKKYSVNKLVRMCLEFLEKGRSSENICEILEQAHFYNENDFREKSVKYILDNAKSVLGSSSFLELCQDCVKLIIEYDELQADERTVLEAVTLWGEHQCEKKNLEKSTENLRTVLGDILYLVRFPLLGETYFTNVVSDTGLLTDAEKAMFTNDFADSRETIQIPDIEVDIFEKLLTFMYTDDTDITGENVLPLLYTAKKYSVNKLVRMCLEFLEKGRSSENICEILEQAHFYNENDFREKSVKYILDNAKSVLGSSSFLELCQDCVKLIIEYDELQADERTVLEAVTLWGEHQCEKKNLEKSTENLRTVLGDILYLVRFPLLGETYFTNVVSDTGLLTDAEKVELFKYFYKQGYKTEKFISRNRYAINETTRHFVTPVKKSECRTIQTCLRFNRVCEDGSWYCGGEPDAISFTSSQNIMIHGVLVYGTYIGEGNYDVTCSLNDSSETELAHIRKQIKTVEHQLTYEILFKEDVEVQREKRYSVLVKLTNPYGIDTYQGLDGNASVSVGNVKFNFTKSKNSRNGTDVKIGQIPGLLFSTLD